MEMTGTGPSSLPHLPQAYDFRNGKIWPNQRPGLGVELDTKPLKLVANSREAFTDQNVPPAGWSMTNW